jgi:hypothetical protein
MASLVAVLLALAWATPALAGGKEMTISGEAKCAKCALKEAKKCQTVIQAKEDGKTVTYYLTANDVAKNFHENVCTEAKMATATGTDKVVNGKHEFTATKVELATK